MDCSPYDELTKVVEIAELEKPGSASHACVKKPFTYWSLFDPGVLFTKTARNEKRGRLRGTIFR